MVLLDHRASQMSAFRRMSDMMRLAITTFYSVFPANSGTVLSNRLHDFKCPFQIIFVLLGVRRLAYKISSYTRMGWQYVTEDPNKRDCIEYKSPLIGKFLPVRENGCSYSAKTETSRLCKILRLLNKSKGRTERKQNGVQQERKKEKKVTKREARRDRILDHIKVSLYTLRIYLCTPTTLNIFAKRQIRLLGPRQHAEHLLWNRTRLICVDIVCFGSFFSLSNMGSRQLKQFCIW